MTRKTNPAKHIICLAREHCICISKGRVCRLVKQMKLPKMSTVKPPKAAMDKRNDGVCQNLLSQRSDQRATQRWPAPPRLLPNCRRSCPAFTPDAKQKRKKVKTTAKCR